MFKPGRKRLSTTRIRTWIADDTGAAALIIAAVVAVIAFTALSIFLNKFIGGRELQRAQSVSSNQGNLVQAVFASFLSSGSGGTYTLPCPDTAASPTGAAGTCNSSTTTAGVLPWVALGLSRSDAIDAYGNYYTYVVSSQGKTMCQSIGSSAYTGVTAETTGALTAVTDLTLSTPTGTRNVAFAIVGHGANRRNAKSASTGNTSGDGSTHEQANGATGLTGSSVTVYADAFSNTSGSAFDDQVFAPSNNDMEKICKSLTPGGQLNAALSENFDGASQRAASTPNSAKFAATSTATVIADARTNAGAGNYVVSMATAGATLASHASNYNFDPRIRRIYMSARWTPDPLGAGATDAGISFASRATSADRTSTSDDFTSNTGYGVTFRFSCGSTDSFCGSVAGGTNISSGAGAVNYISIREGGSSQAHSSGSYHLITGETYIIEAFDDGNNVWARITQEDDPSNTAYVAAATTADLAGSQQLIFIDHGAALSYLDDVTFGVPMLSLETNGTGGYAATAAAANGFLGSAPHSLTLEAWVRPKVLPTGSAIGTIVSKWSAAAAASANAYRMYVDSSGVVHLDLSGDAGATVENKTTPIKLKVNTWTHVAVTYDAPNKAIKYYQNGVLTGSAASAIGATTGVTAESARCFSVGASNCSGDVTVVDGFNGSISDVRVWEEARSAANILANYENRLAYSGTVANLLVNWKLDQATGSSLTATTPAASNTPSTIGSAGVVNGTAAYAPTLALYFRPFSTTVCPTSYVGPYQCDFRTTLSAGLAASFVGTNLAEVYVKAWGAGGGGYSVTGAARAGGGGGFSGAIMPVNGTSPDVYVGGYGTGSSTAIQGGGGGGGSGVYVGSTPGVIAGGGGGASYSVAGTCSSSLSCGSGGAGGGANGTTGDGDAPGVTGCYGRAGNRAPFSGSPLGDGSNANCEGGGQDPLSGTRRVGGAGTGANAGGGSATILGGGAGNSATGHIGGGGGGGGAIVISTVTYGGGEAGGYDTNADGGYGGGGGAGSVGTNAANVQGATGGVGSSSYFSNSQSGSVNNGATTITGIGSTTGWTGGSTMWVNMRNGNNGLPGNTKILTVSASSITVSLPSTANLTNKTLTVTDYFYDLSQSATNVSGTTASGITTTANWSAGMNVEGSGIPAGTTIQTIDSATQITLSQSASTGHNIDLTVYSSPTGSTAGSSADANYSPSYLSTALQNPGRGGTAGSVNGKAGAVVILW